MNNGLGKTLQAVSIARYKKLHNNMKHCLIVCGVNALKWNWKKEINKFCKEEKAIILGTKVNKKTLNRHVFGRIFRNLRK